MPQGISYGNGRTNGHALVELDQANTSGMIPYIIARRTLELELAYRAKANMLRRGDRELILGFQELYRMGNEYEMKHFGRIRSSAELIDRDNAIAAEVKSNQATVRSILFAKRRHIKVEAKKER